MNEQKQINIEELIKELNAEHSHLVAKARSICGFEGNSNELETVFRRAIKAIRQLQKGEVK